MANFFAELKRRHIYRVAAAYAVVAWLLVQLVNNLAPIFELPPWIARAVVLLLIVGFPITILIVWMRELAPADGASARAVTSRLDWVLVGGLAVVIGLVSYQQLALAPGATNAQQQPTTPAQPGSITVAVLPFANVSGDTSQDFFSDGMTDEIMTALAKIPSLQVVARTSAFEFKGQNRNIQAIGQQLHTRYLIEGSVRKEGTRVRITAQLVQADNGVSMWTDSYDRELTSVFATQEDIAQAIAGALRVPLGLQQGDTLVRDRTSDLDSYQQYLRAKALFRARAITDAINMLESVVALDPGFAPAWALLAQAYVSVPNFSPEARSGALEDARRNVQSALDQAEKAAAEAIRLDSRNAIAFAALASIQARRGSLAAAEDLFKRALALDPNEPEVLRPFSTMLLSVGRLKESLGIDEKLLTLEPFVPTFKVSVVLGMHLTGQSRSTILALEALPQDAGGGFIRNTALAYAYAGVGRYAEAADTLLAMPQQTVASRQSVEDAARLLRSAPTKVKAPEALPVLEGPLNFVYAHIGALDRVMEYPERSLQIQTNLTSTIWLPLHAPVRKTERFKTYARNAGLVDYWRARGWPDLCRPVGADDFVCD